MPGLNHNFDPSSLSLPSRLLTTRPHIGVIAAILTVQVWGMSRFYYVFSDTRYSPESILLTIFWVFIDIMVIQGILTTKNSDPGYLLPTEDLLLTKAAGQIVNQF